MEWLASRLARNRSVSRWRRNSETTRWLHTGARLGRTDSGLTHFPKGGTHALRRFPESSLQIYHRSVGDPLEILGRDLKDSVRRSRCGPDSLEPK